MQPKRLFRLSLLCLGALVALHARLSAATSKLDLRTGAGLDPCTNTTYRANFRIDNHDSTAVDVGTLTVRYWFNNSSAINLAAGYYLYIYSASGAYLGYASITGTETVMGSTCTLGGRSANRYMDISFSSFSIPAGGYATPNGGYVDMTSSGIFDSACDDYSGTSASGLNEINRMALYQSGSLVCEYTDASTRDPNTGVEPCSAATGCGAASTPSVTPTSTPTPSASPSATPTPAAGSPTATLSRTPAYSPTATGSPSATRTATPVLSPTATPTASPTSAVVLSPTPTRTPSMTLRKSVSQSTAILGDTLTFYLNWSNDADSTVSYQIWDSVSSYLTYLGCSGGCSNSGTLVSWSFPATSGSSGQVAFWATVSAMP